MGRPRRKIFVPDTGQSISYGPSRRSDDSEWMLGLATDVGRIEIHLSEAGMYELWTEVKGVPWPEKEDVERHRLQRMLVEYINGADRDMLLDLLEVADPEGDHFDVETIEEVE